MTNPDAPSSSPWSALKEGMQTMMTPEAWQLAHSEFDRARLQVEHAHQQEVAKLKRENAGLRKSEVVSQMGEMAADHAMELASVRAQLSSLTQELRATGCQRDALRAELTYRKREHELARQRFKARSRPAYEGMAGMHTKEAADPSPADASPAASEAAVYPRSAAPQDSEPCHLCGGPCLFDTVVPSVIWNEVIRAAGTPEWLCAACILQEFAKRELSFTCELLGGGFVRLPIAVHINSRRARDSQRLCVENTDLRWRLREAERGCVSLRERAEAALLASTARSVECDCGYKHVAEQLRAEIDTLRGARAELKAEVLASTARQEQLETPVQKNRRERRGVALALLGHLLNVALKPYEGDRPSQLDLNDAYRVVQGCLEDFEGEANDATAENHSLRQQVATLTEALTNISETLPCERPCVQHPPCPSCGHTRGSGWCAGCIARAALQSSRSPQTPEPK